MLQTLDAQLAALVPAILLSFIFVLAECPLLIPLLQKWKFGQTVRTDIPEAHQKKSGTPTMGGIAMILALVVTSLLLFRGDVEFLVVAVLATVAYGLIGFLDDSIKVIRRRNLGLKAYQKIIGQLALALLFSIYAYRSPLVGSSLYVPILNTQWDMGIWYIPFTMFVLLSLTNCVNLIDGLDGLATSVTSVNAATYALIFAFMIPALSSQPIMSDNMRNLMVFSGALLGAALGFLRFNTHPARLFMGDTGSMALGGALAAIVILSRLTLLVPITGGCFVATGASVILQIGSVKLRGKRIFKMSPIHHAFELRGVPETKIVTIYTLVTILLCLVGVWMIG